jgi:hypothetical protein
MLSYLTGLVLACNIGVIVLWPRFKWEEQKEHKVENRNTYFHKLDSIRSLRDSLGKAYQRSGNEKDRSAVLKTAKITFLNAIQNDIFTAWYSTPWDFYGTTDTPQVGAIACGYFVTTSLRDMGVRLDRTALAECASETMIRKLIASDQITVYRAKTVEEFISAVLAKGDGLYIIGLDWHTGFLLCEAGQAWFIHSYPPGVRKESPYDAPFLVNSKYRVIGSITGDTDFFKRWILKTSL